MLDRRRFARHIIGIGAATLLSCRPEPKPLRIADTVRVERRASNGNRWRAAFDVDLRERRASLLVRVRLIPGAGISAPQLERLGAAWKPAVEQHWSERFALVVAGVPYSIGLAVNFGALNPHHTAVVRDDGATARVDQLNWSRWSSGAVVAHEVGHMLGAYDEYAGGSQNPDDPMLDPASVMGAATGDDPRIAARHFEALESWARTRIGDARIAAVVG
jgi:serralysin